uniref:Uncharacterized protein n=1 Tax=Panagrolaimus sp. ES5 TaxID=591445 RepID=A0AC34H074_9BILA
MSSSSLIPYPTSFSDALPILFLEARVHGNGTHQLITQMGVSIDADQCSVGMLMTFFIGKIGGIDPGKIGVGTVGDNRKVVDRRPLPLKFVDSPVVPSDKIRDSRLSRVFIAYQHIYYSFDYRIVQLMLPQVILQGLLENNTSIINEARSEIFGVFRKSLSRASLNKVVGELCDGTGELFCVEVAEKYNFGCRALRWLEQYGIKVALNGKVEFNRAAMYALERIYLQLSDTDGVLGANETIQNHSIASPQERVVAF